MAMSVNAVRETAAALKLFDSMEGVAFELGISVAGLTYRLNNDPSLMEIAISQGLYKPRKKANPQPAQAPAVVKKEPEPEPETAKPAANIPENIPVPEPEPEPVPDEKPPGKRRGDGTHRMDVDVPDELYAALERQAKREMRPVRIQALWIIKQALSEPVEIER